MSDTFESDPYPGGPRILFIAHGESSHTQAWIDTLADSGLNVRLFSLPTGMPPPEWPVRTYVVLPRVPELDPQYRRSQYSSRRLTRMFQSAYTATIYDGPRERTEQWLAQIIEGWKPDIIHTTAIRTGAELYYRVRKKFGLEKIGKWVIQILGGSDLTLEQLEPQRAAQIATMMAECDMVIADNVCDYRDSVALGLAPDKVSSLGIVPTTGGIDIDALASRSPGPPSTRRTIVMPKSYEFFQSKTLPVYEALKLAWDRIGPCEVIMLAAQPETIAWARALPQEIQRSTQIHERIPHSQALDIMSSARVMLAPSLLDGTPNCLLEAMAVGAMPIVSPIETISQFVDETNVLFARNLYPHEIADALVRAMNDDALVDSTAVVNLEKVRRIADRNALRPRIIDQYRTLATSNLVSK